MDSGTNTNNWFNRIRKRLKKTGDSEPEQALLRLVIGFILIGLFCIPWRENETFLGVFMSSASLIVLFYYINALALFLAIAINPVASPARRIYGSFLDMTSLSVLMFNAGAESFPLFFIYLWVVLGNGFRFGIKYLYISHAISIIGFLVVVLWGDYWQQHRNFGISLFLMLLLLPLYAAFLLKKLHAAIDSAKQANEAKSRFLANMSHELRTPLNGVIGMGDLLRETNLNHEQLELVESMHGSANTLLELIENILDISKIEAGKLISDIKDFDLHKLVNTVLRMMMPMGEKKGLRVSCNFDPETPFELKGDQRYIHQILVNLINNAIKFTDKGSVVLSVKYAGGSESKPRVRFEVSDTGIGIDEDNLVRIFDNFTQADAGTSRVYGGTGLGTTISKELVELMGGTIGVESQLNHGTTFWFELPFITSTNLDTSISENRILLLAGEETASIVRPSLKDWNVQFNWIRSTARAISLLLQASDDNEGYQTIIVDQSCLVDINAVQFAQMIRSEPQLEDTTLVLINSSDTMIEANRSNQFYISTICDPQEKRSLFNAIHAAQSISYKENNIVTMAEHYAQHSGAKGLNILVAEDNRVNQQVIEGILRNAGHKASIVSSGSQALDMLADDLESFEMVILDMNMPEISGIEVVKSLRFMDTKSSIPVIMLTADATPEAREASLSAGANRFLTKPVDARNMLECIASLSRNIRPVNVPANRPRPQIFSNFELSKWYDHQVLDELEILGNDPEFLKSLIENFNREGSLHISQMKVAVKDDYLEYRENLHALKGSATELGANKLVKACLQGESLKPYDINTESMSDICNQIEVAFEKTVTALDSAVTVKESFYPEKLTDQ